MLLTFALNSLKFRPLRTFLTALGIAVAVGSTTIFLSLGEGLREAFSRHIGTIGPEIQVSYGPFNINSFSTLPQLPLEFITELENVSEKFGINEIIPLTFFLRAGLVTTVYMGFPLEQDMGEIYLGFEVIEGRPLKPEDSQMAFSWGARCPTQRN